MSKWFYFLVLFGLFSCSELKKTADFSKHTTATFQVAPDSVHARGIAVLGEDIVLACNNGLTYRFNKKSNTYKQLTQLELVELRDIYFLSEDYFLVMQSAEKSILLLSKGSVEIRIQPFLHPTFLDGLDINTNGFGVLMGDPLEDSLKVAVTSNYGLAWNSCSSREFQAAKGEAGFAASGSTVQVLNDSTYVFVTGGLRSRFLKTSNYGKTWTSTPLDFVKSEASGPFSMHFWSEKEGIVVGGDYTHPNDTTKNCYLTIDGGKTWTAPIKTTSGYKSSVISCKGLLFACGTNGMDVSLDKGRTWQKLNDENTFALFAFEDKVYATMKGGKVLEIDLHFLEK